MDSLVGINSKKFTERERSILIFCLKRRIDNLKMENNNFFDNSKSWKEFNYYPVLNSRFKLEDNSNKLFTKAEKLSLLSCVNEELINNENEELINEIIVEELKIIRKKFKS